LRRRRDRATVFRYFPNREALFEVREDLPASWLMESLIGIVVSGLQMRPSLGVEDTVEGITSLFLDGARLQQR
jgi:hypothetical protein